MPDAPEIKLLKISTAYIEGRYIVFPDYFVGFDKLH